MALRPTGIHTASIRGSEGDESAPIASAGISSRRTPPVARWFGWLGLIALAGYALFLAAHTTVVAGGSDSSGYLNGARVLAAGKLQTDMRVPPEFGLPSEVNRPHFSPAGFNTFRDDPHLTPVYPTGLPLHFALAGKLFGWNAGPFIVQLLASVGAVWLCYRLARELGLDFALSSAGAVMLAVFPVFIFTSIQTLSDTLATTWTLAALLFALKARTSSRWALACGAALAVAVLVRPTNLLLAPALMVLIGPSVPRLALFFAGGIPGAAWLALYNHTLFGSPMASGYGNIFADFGSHYVGSTARHFARWILLFLPAVMLIFPFAALARRDTRGREIAGLMLAVAAVMGLYLFYGISQQDWWCLRFILPAIAALIPAGLLGVEALARGPGSRWPRAFRPVAALVLGIWAAGNSWYWTNRLSVYHVPKYEQAYADAAQAANARLPHNALVVCSQVSGALHYYTGLPTLIFDSIKPEEFARYTALARRAGRPIYAVLFDIEENDALRMHCPGSWSKLTSIGNIGLWMLQD